MTLHEWAEARGLSPFHPSTWSAADTQAFIVWKIERFKAKWKTDRAGYADRRALIDAVRRDVREALAKPPSETYTHCPCHRHQFGGRAGSALEPIDLVGDGEIYAWVSRDPARRRLRRKTVASLVWMEKEFGPRAAERRRAVSA